jgi:hypothetical protein
MSARFALYGAGGSLQILELAGREEWALSQLPQDAPAVRAGELAGSKVERLSDLLVAA